MVHHHHDAVAREDKLADFVLAYEAHVHEGAVAASCRITPQAGSSMRFSDLVEKLVSVAESLEAEGAFLGHVKAFARTDGNATSVSLTSLEVGPQLKGDAELVIREGSEAQAVAIIVGLTPEEAISVFQSAFS